MHFWLGALWTCCTSHPCDEKAFKMTPWSMVTQRQGGISCGALHAFLHQKEESVPSMDASHSSFPNHGQKAITEYRNFFVFVLKRVVVAKAVYNFEIFP